MKKILLALFATSVLFLTGCSEPVPPAHMGKVLMPSGYSPEVYPAGRVGGFYFWSRKKLVLLETGTQTIGERVTVKLKDDAELAFDVYLRTRIGGSDKIINSMFDDIVPVDDKVTLQMVYNTYGRMVVRNQARMVVNDYTVKEVSQNFDRISGELILAMKEAFEGLPLDVSDVSLGAVKWPDEVTAAVNATLKSQAEIAKIEADKLKDIADAKARKAIADANYNAQMREAETIRDYNNKVASGISDKFLRLKALQVQEKMVEAMIANPNASTVYLPYDAMATIGAQNKMFSGK